MRQLIQLAGLAAALLFVPIAAPANPAHDAAHLPAAVAAPVPAASALPAMPSAERDVAAPGRLAPGQARADYYAWLAGSPGHRAEVEAFRAHLAAHGVADVVPVWQLIRTSSSWRACNAARFEVAPRDKWAHITTTLRFVRDEVVPAIGPVEALSAYRNEALNRCSDGAPASAHREFFALDLAPADPQVGRAGLIRRVCAAHARDGRAYDTGLGFYHGMRFHVDSNGYRKWGADGRGASSPCG